MEQKFDEHIQKLTQKFKLEKENNKWFVVSDDLEFAEIEKPLTSEEELKVLSPNNRKPKYPRKPKSNPFAPYIPSQNK